MKDGCELNIEALESVYLSLKTLLDENGNRIPMITSYNYHKYSLRDCWLEQILSKRESK